MPVSQISVDANEGFGNAATVLMAALAEMDFIIAGKIILYRLITEEMIPPSYPYPLPFNTYFCGSGRNFLKSRTNLRFKITSGQQLLRFPRYNYPVFVLSTESKFTVENQSSSCSSTSATPKQNGHVYLDGNIAVSAVSPASLSTAIHQLKLKVRLENEVLKTSDDTWTHGYVTANGKHSQSMTKKEEVNKGTSPEPLSIITQLAEELRLQLELSDEPLTGSSKTAVTKTIEDLQGWLKLSERDNCHESASGITLAEVRNKTLTENTS